MLYIASYVIYSKLYILLSGLSQVSEESDINSVIRKVSIACTLLYFENFSSKSFPHIKSKLRVSYAVKSNVISFNRLYLPLLLFY